VALTANRILRRTKAGYCSKKSKAVPQMALLYF